AGRVYPPANAPIEQRWAGVNPPPLVAKPYRAFFTEEGFRLLNSLVYAWPSFAQDQLHWYHHFTMSHSKIGFTG
ncbi:MAG: hypothetical protein KIH69_009460, partial [Anaerolineae bacterium]|nr:hypothetical protein [Anaerolineae bacterium]